MSKRYAASGGEICVAGPVGFSSVQAGVVSSVIFGILVFDGVEELDFIGPWELVGQWSRRADGPRRCLTVSQRSASITCANGLTVTADTTYAACPSLDVLLVPGGQGTRREVDNDTTVQFIADQAGQADHVLSVCTGTFLLHAAGLLRGKTATTHWAHLNRLRELPDVQVAEERFVRDGRIWTAAGVSAGMDLILAFIAETAGSRCAGIVQAAAEYFPSGKKYGDFPKSADAPKYLRGSGESFHESC